MQRRDQKARARSRASWQNMITCGVLVLAIFGAEFSWAPNLASRFQQTGDPEEVQDVNTKKYLELSTEELQRGLAPEEGEWVNTNSMRRTPSPHSSPSGVGWICRLAVQV